MYLLEHTVIIAYTPYASNIDRSARRLQNNVSCRRRKICVITVHVNYFERVCSLIPQRVHYFSRFFFFFLQPSALNYHYCRVVLSGGDVVKHVDRRDRGRSALESSSNNITTPPVALSDQNIIIVIALKQ